MRKSFVLSLAVTLAFATSVIADQTAAKLTGPAAARTYEREKTRLLKTAELMPAEHYAYRQVVNDKPFSAQLIAVARLGTDACGDLIGKKGDLGSQDPQATIVTKPDVAVALSKGFGTCDAYFRTLADGAAPAARVVDILDHMQSMAVYLAGSLRAKGIEPPR